MSTVPHRTVAPAPRARAAPQAGPLLQLRDLQTWIATARGAVRAVDGVTLELDRGEILGVVGESGSGKSILARSVLGLLPPGAASSGTVRFDGLDVLSLPAAEREALWGSRMAMVFQDAGRALNPVLRIGRQMIEPMTRHLGLSRASATERAADLLAEVGVPDPRRLLTAYPHELSGGMRQRAMIATALSCDPALLIADEPTTALDVTVQRQILDLLVGIRDRHATAVVLISHDLGIVQGRTDRVAVMYAGRVTEAGPTEAVFAAPRHRYTAALLATTPRLTGPLPERMPVIAGTLPDPTDPPPGCRFAPRCPAVQADCAEEDQGLLVGSVHTQACRHPVPVGAQGRQ